MGLGLLSHDPRESYGDCPQCGRPIPKGSWNLDDDLPDGPIVEQYNTKTDQREIGVLYRGKVIPICSFCRSEKHK